MKEEKILCAAIHYDDGLPRTHQPVDSGLVLCGYRHHQIIEQFAYMMFDQKEKPVQGFLTTSGRFLDRGEAANLAYVAGQIKEAKKELFSEDLY